MAVSITSNDGYVKMTTYTHGKGVDVTITRDGTNKLVTSKFYDKKDILKFAHKLIKEYGDEH